MILLIINELDYTSHYCNISYLQLVRVMGYITNIASRDSFDLWDELLRLLEELFD